MNTFEAARGLWQELLPRLGVPETILNGRNQPCPICGGRDRFRFDNRTGDGDYYCNQCGAGKGLKLVAKVNGWDYGEAAKKVRELVDRSPGTQTVRKSVQSAKRVNIKALCKKIWKASRPIALDDPAGLYLASRGLRRPFPKVLRYVPELYHSRSDTRGTGFIAIVCDAEGKPATLHRTYLTEVEPRRMMMPGAFPKGGAIRLCPAAEIMGVAEGIETALAASLMFGIPVWSTVAGSSLKNWQPPKEAKQIVIFGDNDENYFGQDAAFFLANRLSSDNPTLTVQVRIPPTPGNDWNDEWLRHA